MAGGDDPPNVTVLATLPPGVSPSVHTRGDPHGAGLETGHRHEAQELDTVRRRNGITLQGSNSIVAAPRRFARTLSSVMPSSRG
jgi:hypothetical protein